MSYWYLLAQYSWESVGNHFIDILFTLILVPVIKSLLTTAVQLAIPYDTEFSSRMSAHFQKSGWKILKRPGGYSMPSLVGGEVLLCEDSDKNLILFCESKQTLRDCKHITNAVGQIKADIYDFWFSNLLVDLLGRFVFQDEKEYIRILKILCDKGVVNVAIAEDRKITTMPVRKGYADLLNQMIPLDNNPQFHHLKPQEKSDYIVNCFKEKLNNDFKRECLEIMAGNEFETPGWYVGESVINVFPNIGVMLMIGYRYMHRKLIYTLVETVPKLCSRVWNNLFPCVPDHGINVSLGGEIARDTLVNLVLFIDGVVINIPRIHEPYVLRDLHGHFNDPNKFNFVKCFFKDGIINCRDVVDQQKVTDMFKILSFTLMNRVDLHNVWMNGKIKVNDFNNFCVHYFSFLARGFRIFKFHKDTLCCVFRRDYKGQWLTDFVEGGASGVVDIYIEDTRVITIGEMCDDAVNIAYIESHNLLRKHYYALCRLPSDPLLRHSNSQVMISHSSDTPVLLEPAATVTTTVTEAAAGGGGVEPILGGESPAVDEEPSASDLYTKLKNLIASRKRELRRDWVTGNSTLQ